VGARGACGGTPGRSEATADDAETAIEVSIKMNDNRWIAGGRATPFA
jgi:hypothetical protein